MEIIFENDHGEHKLKIGEEYDLDIVDDNGEVYPVYNAKILEETKLGVQISKIDGGKSRISKRSIVYIQESE